MAELEEHIQKMPQLNFLELNYHDKLKKWHEGLVAKVQVLRQQIQKLYDDDITYISKKDVLKVLLGEEPK